MTTRARFSGGYLFFNLDFINENLRWTDGRVNPVFYLGKEASRRAELLERIERRTPIRGEHRQQAQLTHSAKERALSVFYTNTARLIAEMLGLGRQYDARHLKNDYESGSFNSYRVISDEECESRKTFILQPAAYAKLNVPELDLQALQFAMDHARGVSETMIADLLLEEMRQHPSMTQWLKTGLDYHREHNLRSCLFCANDISGIRLNALKSALDERVARFFAEIKQAAEKLRRSKDFLGSFSSALPQERAVSPTVSHDYDEATGHLRARISWAQEKLDEAAHAVAEKGAFPNKSNWPDRLGDAFSDDVEALRIESEKVRSVIHRHNEEQDKFLHRQAEAREQLKFATLVEYAEEHETLRRDVQIATKAVEVRTRLHTKLVDRASVLRNEVRDHGPAVGRINALLHAYLGHNEIRLDIFEEGYRIVRHGEVIASPLSEGERTAVALCYFLSKLEEEGRHLAEQIVVVDDPVSSLDAGSLNYAFNLLRGMLRDAQQLIILTHNLAFMNETKKWLRKFRDQGEASFFYIQTWHNQEQGRREARITEMPKLLRGYDSEYQYLFYLVRKCVEEGPASPSVPGYIMPNVIRRVLELFLAFKIPSSEGLGDKINRPLVQEAGLEQPRIQALNRLTQVESHSDSLDDFIGFSSMTIEETHQAAQSVLTLIDLLDKGHYTRMWEISN